MPIDFKDIQIREFEDEVYLFDKSDESYKQLKNSRDPFDPKFREEIKELLGEAPPEDFIQEEKEFVLQRKITTAIADIDTLKKKFPDDPKWNDCIQHLENAINSLDKAEEAFIDATFRQKLKL